MDLLAELLRDPHEDAKQRLREGLDRDRNAPSLEQVNFNAFKVVLDREAGEARVFNVLDASAAPVVIAFDDLRRRLQ